MNRYLDEPAKSPTNNLIVEHDFEQGKASKDKNNDQVELEKPRDHHKKKKIRTQKIKLVIMILLTFIFFVVELVYGYISKSMALVADSFHMLSDVLALIVALACVMVRYI